MAHLNEYDTKLLQAICLMAVSLLKANERTSPFACSEFIFQDDSFPSDVAGRIAAMRSAALAHGCPAIASLLDWPPHFPCITIAGLRWQDIEAELGKLG